jgi:cell division protein FtsQ
VNRVFPSTLEIIIHEREVGAVVEVPSGNTQTIQNWLLSKDAVWLMALPNRESEVGSQISERIYEDAEAALHITNITYGVRPEMGSA